MCFLPLMLTCLVYVSPGHRVQATQGRLQSFLDKEHEKLRALETLAVLLHASNPKEGWQVTGPTWQGTGTGHRRPIRAERQGHSLAVSNDPGLVTPAAGQVAHVNDGARRAKDVIMGKKGKKNKRREAAANWDQPKAQKEDIIEMSGKIVDTSPGGQFIVALGDTGQSVVCSLCGKMKKLSIKCMVGDTVDVELSVYDLSKGRITFRYRETKAEVTEEDEDEYEDDEEEEEEGDDEEMEEEDDRIAAAA
mmetsp:Transcript_31022/g.54834  ORF Transcript_31022/g.54834 Transcript_31022/m.54834 type:complete len:249 (+) Transcript_31022:71-817(+)